MFVYKVCLRVCGFCGFKCLGLACCLVFEVERIACRSGHSVPLYSDLTVLAAVGGNVFGSVKTKAYGHVSGIAVLAVIGLASCACFDPYVGSYAVSELLAVIKLGMGERSSRLDLSVYGYGRIKRNNLLCNRVVLRPLGYFQIVAVGTLDRFPRNIGFSVAVDDRQGRSAELQLQFGGANSWHAVYLGLIVLPYVRYCIIIVLNALGNTCRIFNVGYSFFKVDLADAGDLIVHIIGRTVCGLILEPFGKCHAAVCYLGYLLRIKLSDGAVYLNAVKYSVRGRPGKLDRLCFRV